MIRFVLVAVLALAGIAGQATGQPAAPVAPVAVVDSLELREGDVAAEIFFTAYRLATGEPARPLSFVFNGGPGAASAYLHLGGIGPARIAANDNGTLPAGALEITPNDESWFAFTDLVFVDPVGTGWSRPVGNGDTAPFWGAEQDAEWMARFVRRYLERFPAGNRPIHLVGESYGGYRAIRMAAILRRAGITVTGLALISPVIDFAMILEDGPHDLMASVARLPSYAAAAWAQGRAGAAPRTSEGRAAFLAEVERFAIAEYLPAIAQGDALPAADAAALHARVADFIGLPVEIVARWRARVPRGAFTASLLANDNRVVGLYDASISAPRERNTPDPSFNALVTRLGEATAGYYAKTLGITRAGYTVLNREAVRNWDYAGRQRGLITPPVGSAWLGWELSRDPVMRVLIANGRHDLVTSYFATTYVLRQARLPDAARARVTHVVTEGGHMMYLNAAARLALFEQARAHYAPAPVRAP